MKFSGKLIITDLDESLLNHHVTISDENLAAMDYFRENGGLFTYATGRTALGATVPFIERGKIDIPVVCDNGATIYDPRTGQSTYLSELGHDPAEMVWFLEENFPAIGIEVYKNEKLYAPWETPLIHRHCEFCDYTCTFIRDIPYPWSKVCLIMEPEYLGPVRAALVASGFHKKYNMFESGEYFLEIFPFGINKGEGMLILAKELNIETKDIIAIGNHENDIEMLQMAGTGLAVANSVPKLLKIADQIICSNNDHVVEYVLDLLQN